MKIKSVYPCCKGKCFFGVEPVPRQIHDRHCPKCGRAWRIERYSMVSTDKLRIDRLQWICESQVNTFEEKG